MERAGDELRATVRFSTLDGGLYVHSSCPTTANDAVFFGPDSYRFARLLRERVVGARSLIDVGAGSGVGGLCLADRVERIILTHVSKSARSFARVNAELALVDAEKRLYRDGGALGLELTARIAREALEHLPGGGQLVVHSGALFIDGVDQLRREVMPRMPAGATYEELEPDVVGEEPAYARVDRIAAVALLARKDCGSMSSGAYR